MADLPNLFIDEEGDACFLPSGAPNNLVALPARDENGDILNPEIWHGMIDVWNRRALLLPPQPAPTLAEALEVPEIKALVEERDALKAFIDRYSYAELADKADARSQAEVEVARLREAIGPLVFSNADAIPKNVCITCDGGSVPDIMAWYGGYFAGDRYTVSFRGRNVAMDQNGEPTETARTALNPKGADHG